MSIGYDNLNPSILMDLQLLEGSGIITRDFASPHHDPINLNGPPTWSQRPNDLNYLDFNGATDYLDCLAANTADLDFTSDDYSIALWFQPQTMIQSQILIGRYGVDLDGWEVYFDGTGATKYVQLRHHHVSLTPDDRDGCYSTGWDEDTWHLLTITRDSLYPKMFRNGSEVQVTYDTGGLKDPDTCNRDLVVGVRYTKNANWFNGYMWRPRIWNRALAKEEIKFIFERERKLLGV